MAPGPTIEAPVEQFDLAMVIKMSQAVAARSCLEKLIETLMVIAVDMPGRPRPPALPHGSRYRIEAERRAVAWRQGPSRRNAGDAIGIAPADLEQVIRTQSQVDPR